MNSGLKVIAAGLFAMLIIGCGSDGDSKNIEASDLKGSWVGACEVEGTTSEQGYYEITKDVISVREVTYDNMSCNPIDTEVLHDLTLNFGYVLGDDFTTSSGKKTTKVDLTLTGFNLAKGQLLEQPKAGTKSYTIFYKENNKLYSGLDDKDHNATSTVTRPIVIDFTDPLESK